MHRSRIRRHVSDHHPKQGDPPKPHHFYGLKQVPHPFPYIFDNPNGTVVSSSSCKCLNPQTESRCRTAAARKEHSSPSGTNQLAAAHHWGGGGQQRCRQDSTQCCKSPRLPPEAPVIPQLILDRCEDQQQLQVCCVFFLMPAALAFSWQDSEEL